MKQSFCAILLFFSAISAFPQTRADTFVYVMDFQSGIPEERNAVLQNLRSGIRTAGFTVTEDILDADYLVRCSIKGSTIRIMTLTLLNTKKVGLDARDFVFTHPDETYIRFPNVLKSMLDRQPLRQRPVNKVSAGPETAAAGVQPNASLASSAIEPAVPGSPLVPGAAEPALDDSSPVSEAIEPALDGSPLVSGAAEPAVPGSPLDAWKYKWLFLNARVGVSNRYYLSGGGGIPTVSIFTIDAGVEAEWHLFNWLALQFGANYALDRAEYPRSTTPLVHSTSVLSVPFMLKFIFSPGMATTLGVYGGGCTNFAFLGTTTPPILGVIGGLDLAVKAGPGAVLFDLRYSMDMGNTDVQDERIASYKRMFFTLSAGYKGGFIARTVKPRP